MCVTEPCQNEQERSPRRVVGGKELPPPARLSSERQCGEKKLKGGRSAFFFPFSIGLRLEHLYMGL
jgi:hypothetical protein